MAFKKLSYYLCGAQMIGKCGHAPSKTFLTYHTLNSKVNNWGTEIASTSHVIFDHIKGRPNILADHISRLKSMGLYACP